MKQNEGYTEGVKVIKEGRTDNGASRSSSNLLKKLKKNFYAD